MIKGGGNIANYLITHYKGIYRIKTEYDRLSNQFPRKLDGTLEDIDCYIDCYNNVRIFYFGRNTLQAYIPSIIRGHNIIKYINENFGQDIIFDIEETDSEVLFKFNTKYDNKIIPLLKPKTSGASISPFSSKNLPRNKDYKIPDEDFAKYKCITSNLPQNKLILLGKYTNNFIKSLATKKNTYDDIKADMALKGLKGYKYIHSINKWNEYIVYLNDNIQREEVIMT